MVVHGWLRETCRVPSGTRSLLLPWTMEADNEPQTEVACEKHQRIDDTYFCFTMSCECSNPSVRVTFLFGLNSESFVAHAVGVDRDVRQGGPTDGVYSFSAGPSYHENLALLSISLISCKYDFSKIMEGNLPHALPSQKAKYT